ncbi:hypothetical protein B7494_g1598 [Chlorociboria aeruginascens]|nr:hypothetical protein B7494_g1598 [Chlorociboria aeruginascens]
MKGTSDPISYTCTCPASHSPDGGQVLLFYRYYACPPLLSPSHVPLTTSPSTLANWHLSQTTQYQLSGKIRIASEGYNVTVGGTTPNIKAYIQACIMHWSFSNLGLENEDKQRGFFKPSRGCACVFGGGPANIKVTAESTPMGVTNYAPRDWGIIETLPPQEFHARCWGEGVLLLDVRNHYESRIGYFVDPKTEQPALRPGIRRFSQFPQYVRRWMDSEGKEERKEEGKREGKEEKEKEGRNIMTYCTGGIRCEKGVRYMAENMERREGDTIYTRVIKTEDVKSGPRPICMCEKAREAQLWGGERVRVQKTQGSTKARNKTLGYTQDIDIRIKTID